MERTSEFLSTHPSSFWHIHENDPILIDHPARIMITLRRAREKELRMKAKKKKRHALIFDPDPSILIELYALGDCSSIKNHMRYDYVCALREDALR